MEELRGQLAEQETMLESVNLLVQDAPDDEEITQVGLSFLTVYTEKDSILNKIWWNTFDCKMEDKKSKCQFQYASCYTYTYQTIAVKIWDLEQISTAVMDFICSLVLLCMDDGTPLRVTEWATIRACVLSLRVESFLFWHTDVYRKRRTFRCVLYRYVCYMKLKTLSCGVPYMCAAYNNYLLTWFHLTVMDAPVKLLNTTI